MNSFWKQHWFVARNSQLDPSTLALLQEFYTERDEREKQFEDLKSKAEDEFDSSKPLSMDLFTESWQDSQFWYKDETATILAEQLLDGVTEDSKIAVVSAPSVYIQLRNLLVSFWVWYAETIRSGRLMQRAYRTTVKSTRYDRNSCFLNSTRDSQFSRMTLLSMITSSLWNWIVRTAKINNDTIKLTAWTASLKGAFDRIICDPPFLNEDCQSKGNYKTFFCLPKNNILMKLLTAALTVRWLAKTWESPLRLVQCTGERMESLAHKLYGKAGMRTTTFRPEHSKGLSNEFRCYANFESDVWKFEPLANQS